MGGVFSSRRLSEYFEGPVDQRITEQIRCDRCGWVDCKLIYEPANLVKLLSVECPKCKEMVSNPQRR